MVALHHPALSLSGALARTFTSKTALLVAGALALGFAGLQVNQFSRVTTTGYAIEDLEQQRTERQGKVHQLEAEVAALSSLARIEWEARTRLKMEPARQRLHIEVNVPPPEGQTLPTRYRMRAEDGAGSTSGQR